MIYLILTALVLFYCSSAANLIRYDQVQKTCPMVGLTQGDASSTYILTAEVAMRKAILIMCDPSVAFPTHYSWPLYPCITLYTPLLTSVSLQHPLHTTSNLGIPVASPTHYFRHMFSLQNPLHTAHGLCIFTLHSLIGIYGYHIELPQAWPWMGGMLICISCLAIPAFLVYLRTRIRKIQNLP